MNWARNNPTYNSDSKLFFFSFVAFASGQITSYPLAVIRTQQQAQGTPFSVTHFKIIWNHLRRFTHPNLSCFSAFSQDSRQASGVLQGLLGIYERGGIRGYYNGMGASFVRAIPCALINYTLTRTFEDLVS